MKRLFALALALAMAVSVSVVGFAQEKPLTLPVVEWSAPEQYEDGKSFTIQIQDIKDGSEILEGESHPVTVSSVAYALSDSLGTQYEEGVHYELDPLNPSKITVTPPAGAQQVVVIATVVCNDSNSTTITKPFLLQAVRPPREVQQAVVDAVEDAVAEHAEAIVLDADDLENQTLYAVDWKYLANAWQQNDWGSLGRGLVVMNGTTLFTFDESVIDPSFQKDLSFALTNGLELEALSQEEAYRLIRQLTGDTKNPYVFGFAQNGASPKVTVSHVVPQNWVNQYGHKNLTLFAWREPIIAIRNDNGEAVVVEEAKILSSTKVEISSVVTQRMEFETDTLYGTLVLTASQSLAEENNADVPEARPEDANPNTGGGAMPLIAAGLAVVSLIGAGLSAFRKVRS